MPAASDEESSNRRSAPLLWRPDLDEATGQWLGNLCKCRLRLTQREVAPGSHAIVKRGQPRVPTTRRIRILKPNLLQDSNRGVPRNEAPAGSSPLSPPRYAFRCRRSLPQSAESWKCQMIAAGFSRQAAFVAAVASACNDQMFGGFPGTWSGGRTPSERRVSAETVASARRAPSRSACVNRAHERDYTSL
jgi:hypothetical protein